MKIVRHFVFFRFHFLHENNSDPVKYVNENNVRRILSTSGAMPYLDLYASYMQVSSRITGTQNSLFECYVIVLLAVAVFSKHCSCTNRFPTSECGERTRMPRN